MGPDDEGQKSQDQHREHQRLVTPEWFPGIVGQNFTDDAEGRQNEHIDLGMPEEPEKVLPQNGAAAAADVDGRAVNDQAGGKEKAGRRQPVHQLHDDGRFQRRESEEQKKSGDELAPDEEGQTHPGQPLGPQLNDGGDKVDRPEQGRSNQEDESDQPHGLAVENGVKTRPFVRDISQRRVGCPTTLGGAARHEKAGHHDDRSGGKRPEAGGVDLGEGHVGSSDLQRHDKISKGGESHGHDTEEDHDRAMHGSQ